MPQSSPPLAIDESPEEKGTKDRAGRSLPAVDLRDWAAAVGRLVGRELARREAMSRVPDTDASRPQGYEVPSAGRAVAT